MPTRGRAVAEKSAQARAKTTPCSLDCLHGSMQQGIAGSVAALLVLLEHLSDLRMAHRFAGRIRQQILLGNIGDIFGLRVLREQMVERLVLERANLRGDRLVPFLSIVELGIDIEHDGAKRKQAVANHLTDLEFGVARLAHAQIDITQVCDPHQGFTSRSAPPRPGPRPPPSGRDRPWPWPASKSHRLAFCRRSSPR